MLLLKTDDRSYYDTLIVSDLHGLPFGFPKPPLFEISTWSPKIRILAKSCRPVLLLLYRYAVESYKKVSVKHHPTKRAFGMINVVRAIETEELNFSMGGIKYAMNGPE